MLDGHGRDAVRALLFSDFNVRTLANYLEKADEPASIEVTLAPFAQFRSTRRTKGT